MALIYCPGNSSTTHSIKKKVVYLLSIMELSCISLILKLSRLDIIFQPPKVFFSELRLCSCLETLV